MDERRWNKAWKDLPQKTLQKWVKRIPGHIQEIVRRQGGSEYKEGLKCFKRCWKGDRSKGKLSSRTLLDPDRSTTTPSTAPTTLPKAVSQHQERQDHIPIQGSNSEVKEGDDKALWTSDAEEQWDRQNGIQLYGKSLVNVWSSVHFSAS
jgi:hypothetical protein